MASSVAAVGPAVSAMQASRLTRHARAAAQAGTLRMLEEAKAHVEGTHAAPMLGEPASLVAAVMHASSSAVESTAAAPASSEVPPRSDSKTTQALK